MRPALGSRGCGAVLLALSVVILLTVGCDYGGVTWSAEASSPDGLCVAKAVSRQWGGPGTAAAATTVTIERTGSSQPRDVLGISQQSATISLQMKWLTPTHLDVAYGPSLGHSPDDVRLDYHVAKIDGIEISAHEAAL